MLSWIALLRRFLPMGTNVLLVALPVAMGFDLLSARWQWGARVGTGLQTSLCLVWLAVVLQLDEQARTCDTTTLSERSRQRLWHFAAASVLVLVLAQKWMLAIQYIIIPTDELPSYQLMASVITLVTTVSLFGRGHRLARFVAGLAEHPSRLMALSFLLTSLFGGVLLALPMSVRPGQHVSFLDGWFMATSAVCVTGLAVHGVASTHTFVGQLVLLLLVQVGGLGIMVLSQAFVVLAGRRMQGKSRAAMVEALDTESVASLRRTIRRILGFTFAIEAVGAVAIYAAFLRHREVALPHTSDHTLAGGANLIWTSIFHSVSAFCNAGFSLSRDGLIGLSGSWPVGVSFMTLIVLGGLGFPVLSELFDRIPTLLGRRLRAPRLSLHTRTVLVVSFGLIAVVALILALLEAGGTMDGRSIDERVLVSLFQSVTLRTAGFNTLDIASFGAPALFACCLIMFIGASPGGTGGGLKTTAFAVFFAVFRAELRGGAPRFLDRRLTPTTVSRAVSAAFVSTVVLTFVVLGLLITESGQRPLDVAFEAISAFATVGLSTGVTTELTGAGRVLIILTMLIGRVGPLTFALATTARAQRDIAELPHERLMIG